MCIRDRWYQRRVHGQPLLGVFSINLKDFAERSKEENLEKQIRRLSAVLPMAQKKILSYQAPRGSMVGFGIKRTISDTTKGAALDLTSFTRKSTEIPVILRRRVSLKKTFLILVLKN
eukprot:TRINITY_DN3875_c0_g1_i1.p1 TRINITY_DN3875_c0_g1~~TRINITY_DN3875_c0_g1_i1.p1  ORF type:complete len:117 (-),score=32.15 TRINITY_DN3875_c0_g1_i1:143-493(-)